MAILPDANNELTSDEGNLLEHSLEGLLNSIRSLSHSRVI